MNRHKQVQVWDAVHLKLRKIALNSDVHIKDLASAILLEGTKDAKLLADVLKKLKQDSEYYQK